MMTAKSDREASRKRDDQHAWSATDAAGCKPCHPECLTLSEAPGVRSISHSFVSTRHGQEALYTWPEVTEAARRDKAVRSSDGVQTCRRGQASDEVLELDKSRRMNA
ncbi:hypothetical protein MRX96_014900 [Rhipicephalus microplus]